MMRVATLTAILLTLTFLGAVAQEDLPATPVKSLNQVQIQVWITETNETGLRELGTNLNYTRIVRGVDQGGSLQQVTTNVFNPRNPQFNVTLPAPDTRYFTSIRPDMNNGPGNGIQTQSGAGMVTSVISPGYGTIEGVFRAIEQKADVDLISKPEILVVDGAPAEIHAGGQVPFQNILYNDKGVGQLKVTWQDIGVKLKLTPTILSNDTVKVLIAELGVSDVTRFDTVRGIDLPVFSTRSQTGEVLVPNGQTLVIGGLSSRVVQKSERRVPVVGAIPLIGAVFRGRTSKAANSHLLIFVSPTIVNLRELSQDAERALSFWRDRRWENSERISKEIDIMEQEP
ncbi:MAG: hypothetical protein GWP08_14990 [Nitrospiraceae bacterium]|nr:hypothetical protein [Nitrospiraceae bacterium]